MSSRDSVAVFNETELAKTLDQLYSDPTATHG